jgi:hypothetical protein
MKGKGKPKEYHRKATGKPEESQRKPLKES